MRILISEGQLEKLKKSFKKIHCSECGWEWDLSDGEKDPYTCHKCGHVNKEQEVDERSRSFAFTRKKRLFSKPERTSNPLRYKESDRLEEYRPLTDKQVKSIEDLNKDAKFLTCKNCRKKFTQTTHKNKKSLPICPWCGTHNK
jgi:transcription initiation factor TFIIIB Brf1 subunit/transcription initiation factor TFIIB